MAINNNISITGNLTKDPELHFGESGIEITKLSIAYNHYKRDDDDEVSFFNVVAFGSLAANASNSLYKGDRVNITGALKQQRWEDDDGNSRSTVQIIADEISPSLRWAEVEEIVRNQKQEQEPAKKQPSKKQPNRREQNQRRSNKQLRKYSRNQPF